MTKKAASDLQCPVCGQEAEGRRAVKRVKKWLQDSRLDRFMFDKLMQLVKAQMYGGEGAVERDKLLQQQLASGTFKWNVLDPDREVEWGGTVEKPVQPVVMSPKALKLRDKALKKRQKLKPEGDGEDADADWALNYAEKKNEKLAKDRAYQRDYYHKNKERIDRLRKARAGRVSNRRSPTSGAKANGH